MFAGALGALILMTIISTAMGVIVPTLVSPSLTKRAATVLYLIFAGRLFWIAYHSKNTVEEEIQETEERLASDAPVEGYGARAAALLSRVFQPIVGESLVLTFLAEWGDRSQIATITMAAERDPVMVTLRAILGHAICTGAAVIGGELLAKKISQRTVAVAGGCLFLLFAVFNLTSPLPALAPAQQCPGTD